MMDGKGAHPLLKISDAVNGVVIELGIGSGTVGGADEFENRAVIVGGAAGGADQIVPAVASLVVLALAEEPHEQTPGFVTETEHLRAAVGNFKPWLELVEMAIRVVGPAGFDDIVAWGFSVL